MQGTFPKNLNLTDQMKEKKVFSELLEIPRKLAELFFPPYVCIGNFLHNRRYLKS